MREAKRTTFPLRAFALGVAAMLLIAVAAAATTWAVGNRVRSAASAQTAVLPAASQLERQRELLELFATIAIATGDETYAVRYGEVQPEMRRSLQALGQAIRLPENRPVFERVEQAEREISAIEYQALDLAVEDQREAARALFASPRYRMLLNSYRSGLSDIERRTRNWLLAAQGETDRFLTLNLAVSMVALLLIGLALLILFGRARAWAGELEEARTAAERAAAAKGDFLAVMSHEMRTPLNSIIGFADLSLTDARLAGTLRRNVELVQTSGQMLLTVINDLLDFSKIEAGVIELAAEPFAIETLVDNAVSIIRPGAEAKGLEMRVEIAPSLSTFYAGDENRLRQILLNLLNNAVKFTEAGSVSLRIAKAGADARGDLVRFEVADTGPGIAPEQQSRLFRPFVQADASVTRSYGGTGLGLSISKRLAEAMGGEIGFESAPGRGSTFFFAVPLPPTQAPAPRAVEAAPEAVRGASILLVEDLAINRQLALAMLAASDHRVDVAEDGEQAVEAVRGKRYDLVLMDIQMPRMDGISATRAIRDLPAPARDVPIVAMTANVLPQQVAEFRKAGMNGHVPKPVTQKELDVAIAAALGDRLPVSPDAADAEPAFDEDAFRRLDAVFPPDQLRGHAVELSAEAKSIASGAADDAATAARAHNLAGVAGMLGLKRLQARAVALEAACRSGHGVAAARGAFAAAARDVEAHVLPLVREGESGSLAG
jgi:signal transduction histidine kinase/DNA-binding NarL/FixJ family response regulator